MSTIVVLLLESAKVKLQNYCAILIYVEIVEYYKYQEEFWCYNFTRNSNLIKKWKTINLKKKRIIFESIYKNGWKTVIKLGDIKTEKTNLSPT